MDSGDEDPGGAQWALQDDMTLPQMTGSLQEKFSEYLEQEDFQEGITNILGYLRRLLANTVIGLDASHASDCRKTKEHEIIDLMDAIFSYKDVRADIVHIELLLHATKDFASKANWYRPKPARELRDKFYMECKRAVREFCKLIVRLPKESRPGSDFINWIFINRLLKLVNDMYLIAQRDKTKEKRTTATELLAAILSWLQLDELKLKKAKVEELTKKIFMIVTLKQHTDYDIHFRQSVENRAEFEPMCDCRENHVDKSLRETLSSLCDRDPGIFQLALNHALEEPETIESSSTWVFCVLVRMLRQKGDDGWRQILDILDREVAPRMGSDSSDIIKAKAVWMINICIDDNLSHAQDLTKHLLVMLDFINPIDCDAGPKPSESDVSSALLRKLSQLCWFKVLTVMGNSTVRSDLKETFYEKVCENAEMTCPLEEYGLKLRLSDRERPYDFSFKVCLLATAILQLQLGKDTDKDTIVRELTESIKTVSNSRKINAKSLLEKLLGEISFCAAIYRPTARLDLIREVASALTNEPDLNQ